ncbi:hypothetical protein CYMTET_5974 [Cymbomonas tetramitiformis]|uniref:Uncharacterized protein n=1 Tax=Cymbomonas tetramitiformis TaxID=36881 RepID=A0AAE0LII6_9CHLO|nr:hypothetical protein CYMTET_5974 [Cymbomonas tetramitiformis]
MNRRDGITKFIFVSCTEELARKIAHIPPISLIGTRTAEDASRRQVSLNLEVHPAYTGLAALLVKHLRVFRYQVHIIQIQMSAIALEVGVDVFTKVPVQLDNSVVMEKVARLIARKGGLLADWRPLPVFEGRTAIDGPHVMMKVAPPPEDPTGQTLGSLLHIVVPICEPGAGIDRFMNELLQLRMETLGSLLGKGTRVAQLREQLSHMMNDGVTEMAEDGEEEGALQGTQRASAFPPGAVAETPGSRIEPPDAAQQEVQVALRASQGGYVAVSLQVPGSLQRAGSDFVMISRTNSGAGQQEIDGVADIKHSDISVELCSLALNGVFDSTFGNAKRLGALARCIDQTLDDSEATV